MITIEPLSTAWSESFLQSRNTVFTPVSPEYWRRINQETARSPVRTFVCRDESRVLSWASFCLRQIHLGSPARRPLRIGQAWAIGTLPDAQRKGYARKVWMAAEEELARETDGILIYTDEHGVGFPFYRSMGYLPLAYPGWWRLTTPPAHQPAISGRVHTLPFTGFNSSGEDARALFDGCYAGHAGFLAGRPQSMDNWAATSPFYDADAMGYTPQISWLEDSRGTRKSYAIWAGPMNKPAWKKGAVEIWELACAADCDDASLGALLEPALRLASPTTSVDWWSPTGHILAGRLQTLGFAPRPNSLCVLGTVFDPATRLIEQLRAASSEFSPGRPTTGQHVNVEFGNTRVEIQRDAAVRLIFARSSAHLEHAQGLIIVHPIQKTAECLNRIDAALPYSPWAYFPSEYI
jgi:GNAT superfamily N-acetyltransferase